MNGSARLPATVTISFALHAGLLFAWLHLGASAKKEAARVIGDVDLMIQVKRAIPVAQTKPQLSTFDFLKMALPTPKALPQQMTVKLPQARKVMDVQPRLEERARQQVGPRLESLDLSRRMPEAAALSAKIETRRAAAQALAQLPRLEEVGRSRVPNLPQALALEEKRQEAVQLQRMDALSAQVSPGRRMSAAQAMAVLREAEPKTGLAGKLSSALTQAPALEMGPALRAAPESIAKKLEGSAILPAPRREAGVMDERKKGVEIEGPLASRHVVSAVVPEFPDWARRQGVLEASVSIRFWVAPDGSVLPNMSVEHTSGYGRLDRLAMDSLKQWRFAPISARERQWGVITFRFVLE